VTFSEPVTGINTLSPFSDFALSTTGIVGAAITSVSGSGAIYVVTVDTGSGDGMIRLDVIDDDSIRDLTDNRLGGIGIGNGNFSTGDAYTILKSANASVTVGNTVQGYYIVPSSPSLILNYPNTLNGPVKVNDLNGDKILASQRAIYGNSFNELMGYPSNQFTYEYWFPWYDMQYMQTWILVGNPSTTQTAYVNIYINGTQRPDDQGLVRTYEIAPGANVIPQFPGVVDGPVRVVSVAGAKTASPIKIFTSERSLYGDSFNEVMGYPGDKFTTEYWFPWYDQQYMQTWVLVGNPSTTQTAYVNIYIHGTQRADLFGNVMTYSIPPGGTITPQFPGILAGAVQVVSVTGPNTNSPVNVFASERALYGTSFNEVMGYSKDQLTTTYYYPWYNDKEMPSWILVGNPSTSQTAYVDIYIDGVKRNATQGGGPYSIPPGANITPQLGLNAGPVKVVSVTGPNTNSPINIFTSERTLYSTSFNEMMGYPGNQLTSEYWFTWYDSVYMKTDVLFGRP
jgi:hypothetical protein